MINSNSFKPYSRQAKIAHSTITIDYSSMGQIYSYVPCTIYESVVFVIKAHKLF